MSIKTLPARVSYNSDSAIQIVKSELKKKDDKLFLHARLSNIYEQPCISVLFKVKFIDSFNNYIGEEYSLSAIDLYITSNSSQDIEPIELDQSLSNARGFEITLDTISFENNQIVHLDDGKNILFTEGRFSKDQLKILTKNFDNDIITYGKHLDTNWRCVCGYINELDDEFCKFCQREKNIVLRDYNKSKFKAMLSDGENKIIPKDIEIEEIIPENDMEHIILDDDEYEEENTFNKKTLIPIIGTIAVIIIAFGAFTFSKNKTFNDKLKTADKMVNDGSYAQALELYGELNKSKPSHELSDNIKLVNQLMESDENFKKGEQAIMEKDYISAVNYFKNISPDDKTNWNKVSKHKEIISKNISEDANSLINKGEYDSALELINGYLAVDPTDTHIGDLKDDIYKLKEDQLKSEKEEIKAKEEDIKNNEKKIQDQAYYNNLGENLKSVQTHVNSENANLRYGANIDAQVVKVVPKGSTVYIYDTVVEDTTRVWCDVRVQDAYTGDYYYGWLSNKTIAY